jgi:hypothetical protein
MYAESQTAVIHQAALSPLARLGAAASRPSRLLLRVFLPRIDAATTAARFLYSARCAQDDGEKGRPPLKMTEYEG